MPRPFFLACALSADFVSSGGIIFEAYSKADYCDETLYAQLPERVFCQCGIAEERK